MVKKRSKKTDEANLPAAVYVAFASLTPWSENPRRIPESAVAKVAMSMCNFGFGAPLLARQEDSRLIAGHTRTMGFKFLTNLMTHHGLPTDKLQARWVESPDDAPPVWYQMMKSEMRKLLESQTIPCRLMDLTDEEADQLALADNRLGEEAEWDYEGLARILDTIPETDRQMTGFDAHEIEPLLAATWTPPEVGDLPTPGGGGGSGDDTKDTIELDDAQTAAFRQALTQARAAWNRPDMPPAEFTAEMSRQFMRDNAVVPETADTGVGDF